MRHTRFQCLPHQAMALLEVKRTFASSSNDPSMTLPLSDRDLTGNVPIHLAELIDLVSLDLSFNDDLRLHEPSFQTIIANLSKLNKLHLDRVKISSTAADCFRAMAKSITQLEILTMPGCKLSGTVDNSLSGLSLLSVIDLSFNSITYPPRFFSRFHSPRVLELGSSNLQTFPLEILELRNLKVLSLWSANISGCIPYYIGNLTSLTELDLSDNVLSGGPIHFGDRVNNLESLYLSFNSLSGTIPLSLFTHPALNRLDLSRNQFSGALGEFSNPSLTLVEVDLSVNQLGGPVPKSFARLAALESLSLDHNYFTGTLELFSYFKLRNISWLSASNNNLLSVAWQWHASNGESSRSSTSSWLLGTDPLKADQPHVQLSGLDLSSNQISGEIPSWIWSKVFHILNLSRNNFTAVGQPLANTTITGHLPRSLSNCQELIFLDIGENFITDTFPSWIGELPHLRVLVLRSNQLYGSLSSLEENLTMEYFQDLQIIDIGNNTLNGALPTNLFQSSKLMTHPAGSGGGIYATSPESDEWFRPYLIVVNVAMKELYIDVSKIQADFVLIDLSHNRFHGPIPTTIGKLSALHVLNMSGNAFTGVIPEELALSLTSLEWINLSYNTLSGRIPSGPQFSTFPSSSFQGNEELYGCPLPIQCTLKGSSPKDPAPSTPSMSKSKGDWFDDIMLHLFIGLGFGVGFSTAVMVRLVYSGRRWHYKRSPNP
ncbi:hypothetical protein HU200_010747 [Digitaria exilis]|uniref:Verticillium wilt resistance-like protein n=1 Tax=Digitaria exilis TaxID=1010633 RepID=A0A835KN91_9POAL|nr:hypothetical protein HU200_010747 [Digitaria exilis]